MNGQRPRTLAGIDLNLLLPLHALLIDRSVTRAAHRLSLSQSATSRSLERLRELLSDELLIRSGAGYERTPRGDILLRELDGLMSRVERLWAGSFDPLLTQQRVRLAMTDYAATMLLPHLLAVCAQASPKLGIDIEPWHERSYEDVGAGLIDLAFSPLASPLPYKVEPIFNDRFVCLVRRDSLDDVNALSLDRYVELDHISVETEPHQQNLIDRSLAELGRRRAVLLRVPYVALAFRAVEQSELVLTVPARLQFEAVERYRIRPLAAPTEITGPSYTMVWHPRLDDDPLNSWLRTLIRKICMEQLC